MVEPDDSYPQTQYPPGYDLCYYLVPALDHQLDESAIEDTKMEKLFEASNKMFIGLHNHCISGKVFSSAVSRKEDSTLPTQHTIER